MKKLFLVLAFVTMGIISSYAIKIITSCGIEVEYICPEDMSMEDVIEDTLAIDEYFCG